jgi:hypothetical protein
VSGKGAAETTAHPHSRRIHGFDRPRYRGSGQGITHPKGALSTVHKTVVKKIRFGNLLLKEECLHFEFLKDTQGKCCRWFFLKARIYFFIHKLFVLTIWQNHFSKRSVKACRRAH